LNLSLSVVLLFKIETVFTDQGTNPIPGVLEWWVATQKWVAGSEFLTLDSMRAPKFRH
jgi:hypothetical protein